MQVAMSEIKTWALWRAVLAESLGMTLFVFIGLSAAIGDKNNTYPDQEIKVAFAFGLAISTLAQCLGHISGAHLNPAVTLGLLASCQMSVLRAFFYMIAQILGAVAGSAIVYGIRPETTDSLGVNKLNGISPGQGFVIEFLLTLQLVLCVLAVTDKRRDVSGYAPLAIGLSVGLGHLAGIRYTGCGINPARSFGPAIIQESFDDHWVYWGGPASAGVVAALLYNYLLAPSDEPFNEKTRVLFCGGSSLENEIQEPILENIKAISGTTEPGETVARELKVSLAFAPAISTLVQSLGHISGAHLNPAVTVFSSQISALRCVYWLGPICGGIAAALLCDFFLYPRSLNPRTCGRVLLCGGEDEHDAAQGRVSGQDTEQHTPF